MALRILIASTELIPSSQCGRSDITGHDRVKLVCVDEVVQTEDVQVEVGLGIAVFIGVCVVQGRLVAAKVMNVSCYVSVCL